MVIESTETIRADPDLIALPNIIQSSILLQENELGRVKLSAQINHCLKPTGVTVIAGPNDTSVKRLHDSQI